ncbi:MAG: hypothetical protein MUE69_33840 [Myxococcota bacterium]|nr:hypothetical protein [Myxococcota bacterium]
MTDPTRPQRELTALARLLPGVFDRVERARDRALANGITWPSWCYAPMAAAHAALSDGAAMDPTRAQLLAPIAAAAAWRWTKGIYRFDPDLARAVASTSLDRELPADALLRLPEWCVYVELEGLDLDGIPAGTAGVWAYLEHDANDGRRELRLVLLGERVAYPLPPIHLTPGGTLASGVARAMDEGIAVGAMQGAGGTRASGVGALGYVPPGASGEIGQAVAAMLSPLVSLVLYLCSDPNERDLESETDPSARPANPLPRKTKRGTRLHAAPEPTVWRTGFRLGERLRAAERAASGAGEGAGEGASVRPHVRRAHWHSFWVGPKADPEARKLELRWLAPILVGADGEPAKATVREVKT